MPWAENSSLRRGKACSSALRVSGCAALNQTLAAFWWTEIFTSTGPSCSGVRRSDAEPNPAFAIQCSRVPSSLAQPVLPTSECTCTVAGAVVCGAADAPACAVGAGAAAADSAALALARSLRVSGDGLAGDWEAPSNRVVADGALCNAPWNGVLVGVADPPVESGAAARPAADDVSTCTLCESSPKLAGLLASGVTGCRGAGSAAVMAGVTEVRPADTSATAYGAFGACSTELSDDEPA